jgi:hypothetical protein
LSYFQPHSRPSGSRGGRTERDLGRVLWRAASDLGLRSPSHAFCADH